MEGSFRLGRIAGIEVTVHFTWLLAFGLVTWSLAHSLFPSQSQYRAWSQETYWIVAAIAALLLFASVLLHELSHSLVARARGLPVAGITLFIFGGVTNIQGEAEEAGDEFWMALVGPLTSFLIAIVAWLLYRVTGGGPAPTAAVLDYLWQANLLLGVFNLIPGFPLDGGRVLRAVLWGGLRDFRRATRIAAVIGQGIAYLFILGGIVLGFRGAFLNGIWLVFIGWFLLNAADASTRQAMAQRPRRHSVGAAMQTDPPLAPVDLSVDELVSRYILGQGRRAVLVGADGRLAGLVSVTDVQRLPRDQWASTRLGAVMTPVADLAVVDPDASLHEAVTRLAERDVNQLPVVQDGAPVGMLSRADVIQFLQRHHELSSDGREAPAPSPRNAS